MSFVDRFAKLGRGGVVLALDALAIFTELIRVVAVVVDNAVDAARTELMRDA